MDCTSGTNRNRGDQINVIATVEAELAKLVNSAPIIKQVEDMLAATLAQAAAVGLGELIAAIHAELLSLQQQAKDGTLPDSLKPFSVILLHAADIWPGVVAAKNVPPVPPS